MKKAIYEFNFFYSTLLLAVNYGTRCHYRHLVIRGKERIPTDGPVILAPCHQNALMDPLILLLKLGGPIVFLARADIFKKPAIRAILTFLRIMPAYRIRDGRDQLGRNAETFEKSIEVLQHGVPLCLMAEGTHNDKHQLRPLVKGMFRIAGESWKRLNGIETSENCLSTAFDYSNSKPLYIVPVGMDYDEYESPYSSVAIEIGKPIDVRPFMREFVENEPVALNQMREALTVGLKAVMHHVESTDGYESEYAYCHLATPDYLKEHKLRNTVWNRFQARKNLSLQLAAMPEEERVTCLAKGQAFADRCSRQGVPLWFASKGWKWWQTVLTLASILGLLVLAIFNFQLSTLNFLLANPIVYLPTHLITHRIIKDPQFRSSINYGIRLGLHMVYFLGMLIIGSLVVNFLWALMMVALGLVSAWLMPHLFALLRDVWYSFRWHPAGKE